MKNKERRKRQHVFILLALGVVAFTGGLAHADYVYIDDGENHLIGDSTYQDSTVILDYNVNNSPGTHFQIVSGANVWSLGASNNSTIRVDGGIVSYGISATDSSGLVVNGGTIGTIWAYDQSSVVVSGGAIGGWILASGNSSVEIRGGMFADLGDLIASSSGTLYLYGSNFNIGGVELNYGESLRNYGVVGGENLASLTGIITGTLMDGSLLNSEFFVPLYNPGGADIIVIPEPATSTFLLTAVGFILKRKR